MSRQYELQYGTMTEVCPNLWWVLKVLVIRLRLGWGFPESVSITTE